MRQLGGSIAGGGTSRSLEQEHHDSETLKEAGTVPGPETSKQSQDAPPLAGASQGTDSSTRFIPPELTTLTEVEMQRPEASAIEGAGMEPSGGAVDQRQELGDLPREEFSKHAQDAPPSVGASQGASFSQTKLIPLSDVQSQKKDASQAEKDQSETAGQIEDLLEAVGRENEDSEEGFLEGEGNREEAHEELTSEEVPKHRRTYCRKASCTTCKAQCGSCPDCSSSNKKSCCRERPQCQEKSGQEKEICTH